MATRKRVLITLLVVASASALSAQEFQLPEAPAEPGVAARGASGDPLIEGVWVELVDSVELPATEAGVLVFQGMKEGSLVRTEDVIAKIDSRMQEMEKRISVYEYNAAVKRANDTIEIEYSKKAAEAALAALDEVEEVRAKVDKAISNPEYRKTKLEAERSMLAIKKADNDKQLALLDAHAYHAKVEAAAAAIDRRTILAPFDGEVVKVYRQQQEWVNPGDPILQLIRLDTLRVQGWVFLEDYSPDELAGCEVTIEALGAKGRKEKATGRVVWIDSNLTRGDRSQKIRVRAEISNRSRNGQWVILPNMRASMTIHLGTGGASMGARN